MLTRRVLKLIPVILIIIIIIIIVITIARIIILPVQLLKIKIHAYSFRKSNPNYQILNLHLMETLKYLLQFIAQVIEKLKNAYL